MAASQCAYAHTGQCSQPGHTLQLIRLAGGRVKTACPRCARWLIKDLNACPFVHDESDEEELPSDPVLQPRLQLKTAYDGEAKLAELASQVSALEQGLLEVCALVEKLTKRLDYWEKWY